MVANFDRQFMDPEAYLAWEATQPVRHEYLDGEVYAMTGGTLPHNDLAINLTVALRSLLRGTGCKVRMADAKVQLDGGKSYVYPDVVVSCDGRDRAATDAIRSPILIIEILSPGTERYDRGDKFKRYRRLSSLREYVLIDSTQISVDRYYLNDSGEWVLTSYPAVDWDRDEDWGAIAVELLSLGFELTLGQLYEDVVLPPREEPEQPTA
ncbi:MAG: Uma2 family endonuclease [Cyanophyceae cyanobacterium]